MKTIFYGGKVYTGQLPLREAFAVEDDKFIFAGSNEEALKLAGEGDTVFIGRCADYVLRENPCVLRVFVYANDECRIARIMERHELTRNKAIDMMNKVDHRRSTYYNFYTGQKWGKYDNYALAINSSVLGIEDTAKMIADFALSMKYRLEQKEAE